MNEDYTPNFDVPEKTFEQMEAEWKWACEELDRMYKQQTEGLPFLKNFKQKLDDTIQYHSFNSNNYNYLLKICEENLKNLK